MFNRSDLPAGQVGGTHIYMTVSLINNCGVIFIRV